MARLKNSRHELFCQYYVTELNGKLYNATQAAILAGYSKRTAGSQGSRLLKDVKIRDRIDELKQKALDDLQIDRLWLLNMYKKMVEGKISDYLRYYMDKNGNVKLDVFDSDTVDTWNITEVKIGRNGEFTFKINDKKPAMQKLGEYLKMFKDGEDKGNDLATQLENIKTIAELMGNPRPNRSIEDE